MESIKRLSKNKHYDIIFFDIDDKCCGTVENVTNITNKYEINDYAYKVCTRVPRRAMVTNTDGTESGRWALTLDWYNQEF